MNESGLGGTQVARILASYSNNPSSNPLNLTFFCVKLCAKKENKQ